MAKPINHTNTPNHELRKAFDDTKTGVKGLVDNGITKVPSIFIHPAAKNLQPDKKQSLHHLDFPLIDLENIHDDDPIRRAEVVGQVRAASATWGFFQVVNHGIPASVLQEMLSGARRFYEQDEEERKKWYTRDLDRSVVYNSNFDLYSSPAANWRDTFFCQVAPHLPNPDKLPAVCRTFASWLPKVNRQFFTEPAKADEFSRLPEDCIAKIISFTSPKDACTAAAVSPAFRSAAEYDAVWEHFLPPDYKEIISGSDVAFSTKKELYFLLCDSALLVDGGKMSFRLNSRSTGKKCFMLSARELEIAWIDNPTHWEWTSLPESRFAEVVELRSVCWLDIRGTFRSQTLSANTNYTALLVFKLSTGYYGLQNASKASVKFVKDGTTTKTEGDGIKIVSIVPPRMYLMGRRSVPPGMNPKGWLMTIREDGWHEIKLGNFFVDEGNECDVQIQLYETERLHWKKGLIIEGIEVRPKGTFWNSTRRLC